MPKPVWSPQLKALFSACAPSSLYAIRNKGVDGICEGHNFALLHLDPLWPPAFPRSQARQPRMSSTHHCHSATSRVPVLDAGAQTEASLSPSTPRWQCSRWQLPLPLHLPEGRMAAGLITADFCAWDSSSQGCKSGCRSAETGPQALAADVMEPPVRGSLWALLLDAGCSLWLHFLLTRVKWCLPDIMHYRSGTILLVWRYATHTQVSQSDHVYRILPLEPHATPERDKCYPHQARKAYLGSATTDR